MNRYLYKFAFFMLFPSVLGVFFIVYYHGYFESISEEFGKTSNYEAQAFRIRNGELAISQEQVVELYDTLASADGKISSGAEMMASSTLFYLFCWAVIVVGQIVLLIRFIQFCRKSNIENSSS